MLDLNIFDENYDGALIAQTIKYFLNLNMLKSYQYDSDIHYFNLKFEILDSFKNNEDRKNAIYDLVEQTKIYSNQPKNINLINVVVSKLEKSGFLCQIYDTKIELIYDLDFSKLRVWMSMTISIDY